MAFASMGANIITPEGYGPYCFKVHGQVYHASSPLHPSTPGTEKYAQLYILDTEEANQRRMNLQANQGCSADLMRTISTVISRVSAYARNYKTMHEIEQEEIRRAAREGRPPKPYTMVMRHASNVSSNRYDLPTAKEVAVVFEDYEGEPPVRRGFQVYSRGSTRTRQVSVLDSNLDPMVYPLLFPGCDEGWNPLLPKIGSTKGVTQMEYYAYRIAIRDEFNPILWGGKLFQQYLVDAYCKAESNRLNYLRKIQRELRAESYSGLADYVAHRAEREGMIPGTVVILPSSFTGSARNMRESYLDAMRVSVF